MKTRYDVTCQDDAGRSLTINVEADTDERACDAALRTLNSWRAVKALPAAGRAAHNVHVEIEQVVRSVDLSVGVEPTLEATLVERYEEMAVPGDHGAARSVPVMRVVEITGPESWVKDTLRGRPKQTSLSHAFAVAAGVAP